MRYSISEWVRKKHGLWRHIYCSVHDAFCERRRDTGRQVENVYKREQGGLEVRGKWLLRFVFLVIFSSPLLSVGSSCIDGHFSVTHSEVMVLDWGQSPESAVCFEGIHCQYRRSVARIVCRVNSSLMMSFSVTWREIDPCCVSISKMPPAQLWFGVSPGCCM